MAKLATGRKTTRERLVRAAVKLFQQRGYHGAGLIEILAEAQAPKGSLYHHFPGGKEGLAVACVAWLQDEVCGFLDDLAAKGGGFRLMVEGLARYTAEGHRRDPERRGTLLAVLAQDVSPETPALTDAVRTYADAIRARLADAWASERPASTNPAELADQALAVLHGAAVLARIEGRAERAVEIVEAWLAKAAAQG
jgi:TetR/AcrR family transcriptional repressor of lmrAB and yxaGH operons